MSSGTAGAHAIALDPRRARMVVVIAIAAFVAQGWVLAGQAPASNEALSLHAAPPSRQVVITEGQAQVIDPCTGNHRIVFASGRPSTMLCTGGLAWPVF